MIKEIYLLSKYPKKTYKNIARHLMIVTLFMLLMVSLNGLFRNDVEKKYQFFDDQVIYNLSDGFSENSEDYKKKIIVNQDYFSSALKTPVQGKLTFNQTVNLGIENFSLTESFFSSSVSEIMGYYNKGYQMIEENKNITSNYVYLPCDLSMSFFQSCNTVNRKMKLSESSGFNIGVFKEVTVKGVYEIESMNTLFFGNSDVFSSARTSAILSEDLFNQNLNHRVVEMYKLDRKISEKDRHAIDSQLKESFYKVKSISGFKDIFPALDLIMNVLLIAYVASLLSVIFMLFMRHKEVVEVLMIYRINYMTQVNISVMYSLSTFILMLKGFLIALLFAGIFNGIFYLNYRYFYLLDGYGGWLLFLSFLFIFLTTIFLSLKSKIDLKMIQSKL